MYKSTLLILAVLTLFGCQEDELSNLKATSMEFSMTTDKSTYGSSDNIKVSLSRATNYDFETNVNVDFYLSTDKVYSSGDTKIDAKSDATFSYSYNTLIIDVNINSSSLQSGNYYLIAYIYPRSGSSSSYRTSSAAIYVNVALSSFSFTGISLSRSSSSSADTTSSFYKQNYVYYKMTYNNSLKSNPYIYYSLYISTDNMLDVETDTYVGGSNDYAYSGSGSISSSFSLSSSLTEGNYTLFMTSYYYKSNSSGGSSTKIYVPNASKPLKIIKYVDPISITGMSLSKTEYKVGERFSCVLTITSSELDSYYTNIYLYGSIDDKYSTNDYSIDSEYYPINKGINVVTLSSYLNYIGVGNLYLIGRLSYYSSQAGGKYSYPTFSGSNFHVSNYDVSISGISFDQPGNNINPGGNMTGTVTVVSDITSSDSFYGYYYLSKDNVYDANDVSLNSYYISYKNGAKTNIFSYYIPNTTMEGNYYLILRYQKPNESTYIDYVPPITFNVKYPPAVLYRKTSNTSYSSLHLFIDDVFVKTLDCYTTSTVATCSDVYKAYCSSSGNIFYYSYFGPDGTHNYKLRTKNVLTSGATLFEDNFTSSSTSCTVVDVD